MKKTIITVLITIGGVMAIIGLIFLVDNFIDKKKLATVGVKEVRKADFTIPEFTITTGGIYQATISKSNIEELTKYEIEAVMDDGINLEYNTYQGIRIIDLLELYEIKEYNSVSFMSNGNLQVTFTKDEIIEDMYLVFNKNGYEYSDEEKVSLLAPHLKERYSLTNIVRLEFD